MEGDMKRNTVRINVSGRMFECLETTLERFPESRLSKLVLQSTEPKANVFYDRSATMFEHILDSYRTGSVHIPKDVCPSRFREELDFWGISVQDVALCCWKNICKAEDACQTMADMGERVISPGEANDERQQTTLRQKIWLLIDKPRSSRLAYIWALWMSIVISTSVCVSAIQSIPSLKGNSTEAERAAIDAFLEIGNLPKGNENTYRLPHPSLFIIDMACFVFITFELIVTVVTCPRKRELAKNVLLWLEIIACVSFWIGTFMNMNMDKLNTPFLIWAWIIMNYLTILKLVRLFRITKHMSAFRIIYMTLASSSHEFGIFAILLSLLTCLFGFSIFAAEYFLNPKFDSVFRALYWAVVTLTTVGYGDLIPSSAVGQVIASLCALCGLLVLAMPAGIIVSKFFNYYAHHLYVKRYVETHNTPLCSGTKFKRT